jgi:hypothetical protein
MITIKIAYFYISWIWSSSHPSRHFGKTPWMGDRLVSRTGQHNTENETTMTQVGFTPMIHVQDHVAIGTT